MGYVELSPDDNSSTDTDFLLSQGACGECENRYLFDQTISDTQSFRACDTITAGDGFEVVSPGDVTFTAGQTIEIMNGFTLGEGCSFAAGNRL